MSVSHSPSTVACHNLVQVFLSPPSPNPNLAEGNQFTYNVKFRGVRGTIVAEKSNNYYIF